MDVKISVIIPTLNSQKFLGYALMSIKNHVDEIIIMDMGSTDNTCSIVDLCNSSKTKFYLLKDQIRNKHCHNLDYSIACGLEIATGNVVMRVDDDWVWGPEIKELRDYCQRGIESNMQGLSCLVYNLITTDSYFLPKWRRPTIMFRSSDNPLVCFGSYRTDNNVICHENEIQNNEVVRRRSSYLQTPIRFGHWKFLKDNQKRFIHKWILFTGGTEKEAMQKWHYYQSQPTAKCPESLLHPVHRYSSRFTPLGGFNIEEAVEKEQKRQKKFEREEKLRLKMQEK